VEFYVYCWTNLVNGKKYVGKGKGRRALDHLKAGQRSALAFAILKHGREAFSLEYLAEALTEPEAFALERQYIADLKTRAPAGYNLSDGGEGPAAGRTMSEEEREFHRQNQLGRKHTEESKRLRSVNGKGHKKPKTAEHRAKISATKTGAVIGRPSEQTIENIRQAKYKLTPAQRQNVMFLVGFGATMPDISRWLGAEFSSLHKFVKRARAGLVSVPV
jgi:group I intron endonuclease